MGVGEMAFEIKPYPEWSYSQSRNQLFQECLRKYYYYYYASHNGWLVQSATAEQIQAYRLKQITNLFLVFGETIHRMGESVVHQWEEKKVIPVAEALNNGVRSILNQAYRQSLNKQQWIERPKQSYMLAEIYYDGGISQQKVELIKNRQQQCIDHFLTSKSLLEMVQQSSIEILEVERLNSIIIHETKVYVKIDLLYRQGDKIVIVDWKTGKEDDFKDQLTLYAYYVKDKYRVPLERIEIRTEYLLSGECVTERVMEEEIRRLLESIQDNLENMKLLLDDDYWNRPKEIRFFTPQPAHSKCANCQFQEICRPEL